MARKMVFQVGYFVEVDPDAWQTEYGTVSDDDTRLMISQDLEAWAPDFIATGEKWRTVNAAVASVKGKPFVSIKPFQSVTAA